MGIKEYVKCMSELCYKNIDIIDEDKRTVIKELMLDADRAIKNKDIDTLQLLVPHFQLIQDSFKPGGININEAVSRYKKQNEISVANKRF